MKRSSEMPRLVTCKQTASSKLVDQDRLRHPHKDINLGTTSNMPPIRSARNKKPPPDGFDDIEDTLLEFANKMKDSQDASHEGKKREEMKWPIFQITHQRT